MVPSELKLRSSFNSPVLAYSDQIDQATRNNVCRCGQHDGDDDAGKYVEDDSHFKRSSATDGFRDIHGRFS
jgi:hypothetical protein